MIVKRSLYMLFVVMWICISNAFAAKNSDINRISKEVSSRIDVNISRYENEAQLSNQPISELLTERDAVRLAFEYNPSLQATLEFWGVAKANFDKNRLPDKPVFEVSVRFPDHDEPYNNTEFMLEQDLLSLILFPLKNRLAGAELDRAELQITEAILDLAFEVKSAFYEVQGNAVMLSMHKRVLEQAEASLDLAQRQFDAGNINELGLANEKSLYQDTKLEYIKSDAEFVQKQEELNRLMGFGGNEPTWYIEDNLPEIQMLDPSYEELLTVGMAKRADILIAKKNIEALRRALSLSGFGIFGHPEIGISTEKEVDGGRLTGPSIRTEVPIYDLGQTEISKAKFELKEAQFRLKAIENDARSEIKQKRDMLLAMRTLVTEYSDSILPIRKKVTAETLKHYNFMLMGNFDLIRAKQSEILAQAEYIDFLKHYWITRSDLEKSIGSNLPLGQTMNNDQKENKPTAKTIHDHQHGGSHE